MKCLTLNTHSWLEEDQLKKLEQIATFISEEEIDVIALQEVNQSISAKKVSQVPYFIQPENEEVVIKEDNFGLLLVEMLRQMNCDYYWSWSMCHIGYDKYDEGICLLSKEPFTAKSILVSEGFDIHDYRTRKVLLGTQIKQGESYHFVSCHFSWWQTDFDGFKGEWQRLLKTLPLTQANVVLLGDFNNPSSIRGEGYDLVKREFYDTYSLAQQRMGECTIPPNIDGWKGSKENLRVDFIWVNKLVPVLSSQVVFDGVYLPVVSDHYGVLVTCAEHI